MRRKLPLLLGATFLAFSAMACEGPVGPKGDPGEKGETGEVGPQGPAGQNALNTCSDCHSSDATIVAIEQQFSLSPHGFGNFEVRGPDYARGSCIGCHTSQGFVAAATGGTADFTGGVASLNCRSCHQIHTTYEGDDFALTTTDPVTIIVTGAEVDFSAAGEAPGANLCTNCHQARDESAGWPNYDAPMTDTFTVSSSHYDLHRGPQGNMFSTQLPEGIEYGAAQTGPFGPHTGVSCTGCHMGVSIEGLTPAPTPDGELGHTYQPSTDVCSTCHATDTFDYGGVQTEVMAKTDSLRACLAAEGVIAEDPDHPGEYHVVTGDYPEPFVAAYLVWTGMDMDGSWGVHQPRYMPDMVDAALQQMKSQSNLCPVLVP